MNKNTRKILLSEPQITRKFNLKNAHDLAIDYVLIYEQFKDSISQFSLYRSKSAIWTEPGKILIKLVDDGNGFEILFQDDHFKKKVDYGKMSELFLLLKVINIVEPFILGTVTEEINEIQL